MKKLHHHRVTSDFRSYFQRQQVKQRERLVFENFFKANGLHSFKDLEFLLKRLLYFYELRDGDKLVSFAM